MLDILMIFPRPSATSPQQNSALSIFYPGEAVAEKGFEVDYWDERVDDFTDLEAKAQNTKAFGVSSLSGYMLGRAIKILKWCKERYPGKPTILGGVHATFLPENSLQEPYVDYVVLGEGEDRLPQLLEAIISGKEPEVDGIGFKKNGKITLIPKTQVFDLKNRYVSPVSERTEKYFIRAAKRNEVILPVSRGCPWATKHYACTFCSVREQYLGTYRYVPFEKWADDLERVYALQPFNLLEMEDENSAHFVRHRKYAEFLKSKGIKFHLHLRADQLQNEEDIKKLAQNGCHRIHIGVESGSDRVRNEIYNKGEKVEHFVRAAELMSKYGIEGVYTYVIGAPTETRKEMIETLALSDRLSKLHPKGKSRATTYVLIALPGTDIFDHAKNVGWWIPANMEEWSRVSAAHNPTLPNEVNNIYLIAGLHHNWFHKTRQNFPGWWRLFIIPLQALVEIRWEIRFFKFFGIEKFLIEKLISWRAKKSAGQKVK
jgi:radical SAM superfamily enzyme YgiQ (UPF0313 family)